MKHYEASNILNIALAGHSGAGKTSLAEAMLYLSGAIERIGKIADGNTVCDFDSEDIRRKTSVSLSVAPTEWKNYKINIIDTPGLFDFEGGIYEGIRAADTLLIAISGKDGVCAGTEKAVKLSEKYNLTKVFFVNGLCDEDARFYRVFEQLKSAFGPSVCPVVVPFIQDGKAECYVNILEYKAYLYKNGKITTVPMPNMGDRFEGLRTAVYEAVAETSDEMFEKYFSGEAFTPEEVIVGVSKGVKNGTIIPVFCGDAQLTYGIEQLLNGLIWLAPNAMEKSAEIAVDTSGNPVNIEVNSNGTANAIVFKTVSDAFVGKLSYIKVISGKISVDTPLINMRTGANERVTKILSIRGKKQEDCDYISAGDIGAIPKLQTTSTGDTLCSPTRKVILDGIDYPIPCMSMAIVPAVKGEEDKISQALSKITEEDPTIKVDNNSETHQMIIRGYGEQHLDVVISKLKNRFNVDAKLEIPKIAYRETIRKKVSVQGKHKKQTGGHGQFGDVWIEFEPYADGEFEFAERVVGGAVPKGYFPAVEKGIRESILKGSLAGYPVVNIKATLYDGSYHPVDSSEMAFKMAAGIACRTALPMAKPVLLEPIGKLMCTIPDNNMGDIMGEITKRRGKVLGMNSAEKGYQTIEADVPMAEMHDFSTFVRQSTQGRGYYTFNFERYEEAPQQITDKVIAEAKQ